MPNHVAQRLIVYGKASAVTSLVSLMQGETAFDFNKVDEWRDAFWGRMAVHDAFLTVPPHAALHRPMPATVRQLGDPAFHR